MPRSYSNPHDPLEVCLSAFLLSALPFAHPARTLLRMVRLLTILLFVLVFPTVNRAAPSTVASPQSLDDILSNSPPADWHQPDPQNTLYLELSTGRVVIELAPAFAPPNIANVRLLAASGFYTGLPIERVQDNRVVDMFWPSNVESHLLTRKLGRTQYPVPAEFDRAYDARQTFTKLPDGDVYAPEVGFSDDFPVARDPQSGKTWLVHIYGMVGCGRDDDPNSGGGFELYVVLGAPREWDRNYTLIGRVLDGMDRLSALPRGHAAHGVYENEREWVRIKSIHLAADVPIRQRTNLEVLRSDSDTFRKVIEYARNRPGCVLPAGRVEIANVPIPVRPVAKPTASP